LEKGSLLYTIFSKNSEEAEKVKTRLVGALEWSETKIKPLPLFYGTIEKV
jgi:hypothetical protein